MHVPLRADLGATTDGGGEHPFEVAIAVRCPLAGERAADGVGEQEDPHLLAVSLASEWASRSPL